VPISTHALSSTILPTSNSSQKWLFEQESNGGIRVLHADDNSICHGMEISKFLICVEYYDDVWSEEIAIKYFKDMVLSDVLDFLNNSSIVRFVCNGFPETGTCFENNTQDSTVAAPNEKKKSHKSKLWKPYKQEWSLKCAHCGCLHLKSATAGELRRCCLNGLIDEYPSTIYERLEPMLSYVDDLIRFDPDFPKGATTINNLLAFAGTGVENDSDGGFVNHSGADAAVTMNGRTYHYFPTYSSAKPSGGLDFFLFDKQEHLHSQVDAVNSRSNGKYAYVKKSDFDIICNELVFANKMASDLRDAGTLISSENVDTAIPVLNSRVQVTQEIASVTSDTQRGERTLKLKLADKDGKSTVLMSENIAEPLCYPLFFQRFEIGWGRQVIFFVCSLTMQLIFVNSAENICRSCRFTIT
jgi:hypothetical protein